MYVNAEHRTAILVMSDHILQRKLFPSDVLRLLCLSAAYFSGAVTTTNDLVLQLQLWSAGSLHVAFRNLRESQS